MSNIEKYRDNPIALSASKVNLLNLLFEQIPEEYNAIELVISFDGNSIGRLLKHEDNQVTENREISKND